MVSDDTLSDASRDMAAQDAKNMKVARYAAIGSALFILAALGLQVLA